MHDDSNNRMPSVASATDTQNHQRGEKTIHSGHFMVSCIYEDAEEFRDRNARNELVTSKETGKSYCAISMPVFQPDDSSIDASLAGLFRQMTLAYRGKLVSPKWRNFRGIQMKLKEKIRLNNIIWREWFMQYIQKKRPIVCQFEVTSFEKTHCNPEAIVLEGKYWKRQLQCLASEYRKWRIFYKKKSKKQNFMTPGPSYALEAASADCCDHMEDSDEPEYRAHDPFKDELWTLLDENQTLPNFFDESVVAYHPYQFPGPREIVQERFNENLQPTASCHNETTTTTTTNENVPFHDEYSKERYGSNKFPESLEINETQKHLMNEEVELLRSYQTSESQILKVPELDQSNQFENYEWSCCTMPTEGQQFVGTTQSSYCDLMNSNLASGYLGQENGEQFNVNDCYLHDLWPQEESKMQNNIPLQDTLQGATVPVCKQQNFTGNEKAANKQNNFNQFHKVEWHSQQPQPQPRGERANFFERGNLAPCMGSSEVAEENLLREKLEAARRRASTGSMGTNRNRDKKHVSFAVPNPVQLERYKGFDASRNVESESKFAAQKAGRSSILEQLLVQGKDPNFQQEAYGPSFHFEAGDGCRNVFDGKKMLQENACNQNCTFGCPYGRGNSGMASNSNNAYDSHPGHQCVVDKCGMIYEEQNIVPQLQPANQQLQFFLVQQSTPFHQNEAARRQNYGRGISTQNQMTFYGASNPAPNNSFINNQMYPSYNRDGTNITPFMIEQATPAQGRSRNSSNDSSPGRRLSESARGRKKAYHVSAEHQRRCLIKQGFDTLNELVPELRAMGAGKVNKANTLSKGAAYIRLLKQENQLAKETLRMYRNEIDQLTCTISELQKKLPASGIYARHQNTERMANMSREYIYQRTKENWKFWIFSTILKAWMDSYNESVVTNSREEMLRSIILWVETKCTLPAIREGILSALPQLCKVTSILEDPSRMPQESLEAARRGRYFS